MVLGDRDVWNDKKPQNRKDEFIVQAMDTDNFYAIEKLMELGNFSKLDALNYLENGGISYDWRTKTHRTRKKRRGFR